MFAVIMLLFYPFFPESPYFLLAKGKAEEARESLLHTHGSSDHLLIEAEMIRIERSVTFSKEMAAAVGQQGPGWLQCLKGANLVCISLLRKRKQCLMATLLRNERSSPAYHQPASN